MNKTPITYVPNNILKENYRKEWFDLIIKNLDCLKFDLIMDRSYVRYKWYD